LTVTALDPVLGVPVCCACDGTLESDPLMELRLAVAVNEAETLLVVETVLLVLLDSGTEVVVGVGVDVVFSLVEEVVGSGVHSGVGSGCLLVVVAGFLGLSSPADPSLHSQDMGMTPSSVLAKNSKRP
jgi:hypothetical protein